MTFSPPDTIIKPILSISNRKLKPGSIITISLRIPRVAMTFLTISDTAIYSASVVNREIPPYLIER
jgi:hypothetical protein